MSFSDFGPVPAPKIPVMGWESIDHNTTRIKVPNGWLVKYHWHEGNQFRIVFVEDASHRWTNER